MFDRLFIGYAQARANFRGLPHEMLALRKALGWSRQQLGRQLGVYVGKCDCETVRRWEKGICRPRPHFRAIM